MAGRAPRLVGPEPTWMVRRPAPGMAKLMVSLWPKVVEFLASWALMSLSVVLPALMAVIASRSETAPLPVETSSAVVVTVMTAGASRSSKPSTRRRVRCRRRGAGRRACFDDIGFAEKSPDNQRGRDVMAYSSLAQRDGT